MKVAELQKVFHKLTVGQPGRKLLSARPAAAALVALPSSSHRALTTTCVSGRWRMAFPAASLSTLGGSSLATTTSLRTFSTAPKIATTTVPSTTTTDGESNDDGTTMISPRKLKELQMGYWTKPVELHKPDGTTALAFRTGYHPKLKPRLVARRLKALKKYIGAEKDIRGSEWKLNVVCQTIAGLPLEEALQQLIFIKKKSAPLIDKVLRRTGNLADIRDCLPYSALEVAECFATKGTSLKRVNFHGRGRMGRMEHRFGHLRVVLREIDFGLKIYLAREVSQKKYWYKLQQRTIQAHTRRLAEREEQERLERENAQKVASKK